MSQNKEYYLFRTERQDVFSSSLLSVSLYLFDSAVSRNLCFLCPFSVV